MAAAVPKQYLPLAGRAVIAWALDPLLRCDRIRRIVVATSPTDEHWPRVAPNSRKLTRVDGGGRRQDSVLAALESLEGEAGAKDWALVHDAARPCLSDRDLEALLSAVDAAGEGGLLASPLRDTLKQDDGAGRVAATLPRERLWQALTPQVFPYRALLAALRLAAEQDATVTDEAAAMERAGSAPLIVEGDSRNLKLTRPGDLAMAEALLNPAGTGSTRTLT
jgi:2-C-methyl-D-erythritol 4-phosphate cytidylyltransferase